MWLAVVLGVLMTSEEAFAGVYCSTNTFATNASWMHFTKEPVPQEYGIVGKFKSIHCCVAGYKSIEWFKDGVAYPWSAAVSSLILYPEAANQTLYSQQAASADAGNYTCRLSNDTHVQTHTISLEVLEKPADAPKTMFISKDQWAVEGSQLRLYCEALTGSADEVSVSLWVTHILLYSLGNDGRPNLADTPPSDLGWYKVWPNDTEGDILRTQTQVKTVRDDMQDIIGAYLMIERVSAPDYGTYVCVVHSNDYVLRIPVTVHYTNGKSWSSWRGDMSPPWRSMIAGGAAAAALALVALVFHRRCTPRLLLAARHARARATPTTPAHRARVLEKEFDVVVCWTAVDGELVRGALLPTLALKYKYRVHAVPLPTDPETWYNAVCGEVTRSRSLLAVVSPAQYTPQQLLTALRQLRALPLPPVVVLLQDLPNLKREAKDSGESLVAILRRTRLVAWRHVHESDFWTQLRLALPLPPRYQERGSKEMKPNRGDSEEIKSSRSGSATALV